MKYTPVLILLILCASCEKEENNQPTKTETISSASWKYENGGVDQDKNGTIDLNFSITGLLQPCILDNSVKFEANGTGVTDEGATKCNPAAPQTTVFAWAFANSETTVNISGSILGLGGEFKILTLTSSNLTLSKDTVLLLSGSPSNVALLVNFKH